MAIGNFDGLHLGHKKILKNLVAVARSNGLLSIVMTFSPHPEQVLGKHPVRMIQTLEQRLAGIGKEGVDAAVVVPFNRRFSGLSADEFAGGVLAGTLKSRKVLIGCNFRFGRGREGDRRTLAGLGKRYGFDVCAVPPVRRAGRIVSSSLIRLLLSRGEVALANRLLGRPYEVTGVVVPGAGRGKRLGFPTANLETENEILPPGIFISATTWAGRELPSLANVGDNPTFGHEKPHVETFILDWNRRLYGKTLVVRFLRKIRDEEEFSTPQALIRRMDRDLAIARAYFARRK